MTVEKDKDVYTVKLNKDELFNAFGSYDYFQMFLHEICSKCYGEALANELFPVRLNNMEVIFFYQNGKTEVVEDVSKIEDYDSDVLIITRKNQYNGTSYEVGILKDLIASIKIRYWKKHRV